MEQVAFKALVSEVTWTTTVCEETIGEIANADLGGKLGNQAGGGRLGELLRISEEIREVETLFTCFHRSHESLSHG